MVSQFAQGVVDKAFENVFTYEPNVDPLKEIMSGQYLPEPSPNLEPQQQQAQQGPKSFSEQFFGYTPDMMLEDLGDSPTDPSRKVYRFKGDDKLYDASKNKTADQVLEAIWDKNSPGIFGRAWGETRYNLPGTLSSFVGHSLGGLGFEQLGDEWQKTADSMYQEYNKRYGQYTVPDIQTAWDQGKLYDYALQTIGGSAPYMAAGLAGGVAGGAAMRAAVVGRTMLSLNTAENMARLGSFLGATGITAPVTVTQFADRQVAEMRAAGIEDPEDKIDWIKAGVMGSAASALQALPIDSILFSGPLVSTLKSWGINLGTSTSSRVLTHMTDIAATNAFTGMGASMLSRLNADMPLLDDDAKLEYLESAAANTLVGIPIGAFKGYRAKPSAKPATPPVEPVLAGEKPDAPEPPKIAGLLEYKPEPPPPEYMPPDLTVPIPNEDMLPPAPQEPVKEKFGELVPVDSRSLLFTKEDETYGIYNAEEAAQYLNNNSYATADGSIRNGLQDFVEFWDRQKRTYTDQELIETARRVRRARTLQDRVERTPDGVLFKDIEELPQRHSNTPEMLTKAAALTDQFNYEDGFVKGLSDKVINRLYGINIRNTLKDIGNYSEDMYKQVYDQLMNFVDKDIVKAADDYGSLYNRPIAKERTGIATQERRKLVSKDPRKILAEALVQARRDKAEEKKYEAWLGQERKEPIYQPDTSVPGKLAVSDYGLGDYEKKWNDRYDRGIAAYEEAVAKARKNKKPIPNWSKDFIPKEDPIYMWRVDPMGPRALLPSPENMRPLDETTPPVAKVVKALNRAAAMPGDRIREGVPKELLLGDILNHPVVQRLLREYSVFSPEYFTNLAKKIKAQNKPQKEKAPKATPDQKNQFRAKEEKGLPKDKYEMSMTAEERLKELRDTLAQISEERNAEFIKRYPEFGPILNDMFKAFAEVMPKTEITTFTGKPADWYATPTKRAFKGKQAFMGDVVKRMKVMNIMDNVLNKLSPVLAKNFGETFTKMIAGEPVALKDMEVVLGTMDVIFNGKDVSSLKNVNDLALQNLYKGIRKEQSPDKQEKGRKFMADWHGVKEEELASFPLEDIEAQAFSDFIKGNFVGNVKDFSKIPQYALFRQIEKALGQARKEFKDIGYTKTDDFLEFNPLSNEKIPPQAQRPGVIERQVLDEITQKVAEEKIQEQSDRAEKDTAERMAASTGKPSTPKGPPPPPPSGGAPKPSGQSPQAKNDPFLNNPDNNMGDLAKTFSTMWSMSYLARHYPWIGKIKELFIRQKEIAAKVDNSFITTFDRIKKMGGNEWKQRTANAHEVLDFLRRTDQKISKDVDGRIVFTDETGKQVALSAEDSAIAEEVNAYYKKGYEEYISVLKNFLDEFDSEYAVNRNSSTDHIERVIEGIKKRAEGNPLPEFKKKYDDDIKTLQDIYDRIKSSERFIDKTTPYIPHMRLGGSYVIAVHDKNGNLMHMEVLENRNNIFGIQSNKFPSDKYVRQKIQEKGLNKRFKPEDGFKISHFDMTYNDAGRMIRQGMVSTDLIQSLLASGLVKNMDLAEHIATGQVDQAAFMKDWANDVRSNKRNLLRYIMARGKGRFELPEKKPVISGYSRDWVQIMDTYKNIWKNSVAKDSIALELADIQKENILSNALNRNIKDIAENYIDYMNNPSTDFGGIRNFNFQWALGYRLSPAILQLVTLPTTTAARMIAANPNMLDAMLRLSRSSARGRIFNLKGDGINKGFGDETRKFISKFPVYFRQSMTEDAISKELGGSLYQNEDANPILRSGERMLSKALENSGVFISRAEQYTRKVTFDALYNLYKENPNALKRSLQNDSKDYAWQAFWEHHKIDPDMTIEAAKAIYDMRTAHADFGKVGRGQLQRGIGSVFFPFMTYPQQILETMADQLTGKNGINGTLAGLYTMGSFVALAGVAGVPAYELWKTMYEQYQLKVNGRNIDLNMQLEAEGMPLWARKGLLSAATGLDVSQRMAQDIIAQNLIIGLLKGDVKMGELAGIPGRTIMGVFDGMSQMADPMSSKGPIDILAQYGPAVVGDYTKAFLMASEPENILKTSSGKILMKPEDVTSGELAAQALGFGTLEKSAARERIYYRQKANQEWNQFKSRAAEAVATAQYKMHLGTQQGDSDKYNEGRQSLDEATKTLRNWAKTNNIRLDENFWTGFRTNVKERLWQKKNPGKIKKPTKQERPYLDILTKNE